MGTKTYSDLQREIKALTEEAEKVRNSEKSGVIERMKEAIEAYDISVKELFGTRVSATKAPRGKSAARGASNSRALTGRSVAYADGKGGVWGGRGPRPAWLRNAIASGRELEDFAVGANGAAAAPAPMAGGDEVVSKAPAKKRGVKGKQGLPAKFRDDAGNSWSGRGSQPSWLKAALASGKSLDELRA